MPTDIPHTFAANIGSDGCSKSRMKVANQAKPNEIKMMGFIHIPFYLLRTPLVGEESR